MFQWKIIFVDHMMTPHKDRSDSKNIKCWTINQTLSSMQKALS